jgi:hypothetical protein
MQKALALHYALCIMSLMTNQASIVKSAGELETVASVCSVSPHTVRSWILRDSIPSDQWATFAANGWASTDLLAELAANKRARKSA